MHCNSHCTETSERKLTIWFVFLSVLVIIGVMSYMNGNYSITFKSTPDGNTQIAGVNHLYSKVQNTTMLILLWRPLYTLAKDVTEAWKRNCPSLPCTVSTNRALLSKADAVAVEVEGIWALPKKGKMGQVWIYIDLEAPTYMRNGLKKWNNFFNWTLSYRRDSDFVYEYVQIYDTSTVYDNSEERINNKTNHVSWLVSNCKTVGKREQYVKELQKHIPVDVFGKCGKKICRKLTGCEKDYIQNYKFYLAAENSNCRDYVTEKLVRSLNVSSLPIVKGSANYSLYVPSNSVVHTKDFSSPKSLADYLKRLSSNNELYQQYFTWKKHSTASGVPGYNVYCDICRKLHSQDKYRRLYRSIHDWWRGDKENAGGYFCNEEELVRL